jgi:hypothetical protein
VAAVCIGTGLACGAAFVWWYVGTVHQLDTAANVAADTRTRTIKKEAAPLKSQPSIKLAAPTKPGAPTAPTRPNRVTAPNTSEIAEIVVGVESARLGPVDGGASGQDVLTIVLRITNHSIKPMTFAGWSAPEAKIVLRDGYGNFYNQISSDSGEPVPIKPGETIKDRLVFERIGIQSELRLDLPIVGTKEKFEFLIPGNFVQRPRNPYMGQGNTLLTAASARTSNPQPAPSAPEPYDPEHDEKLRSKIRSDFAEEMDTVNRRKLGKSTNEAALYQRRATASLVKRLAKENDLTEAQVKRIVGLKR